MKFDISKFKHKYSASKNTNATEFNKNLFKNVSLNEDDIVDDDTIKASDVINTIDEQDIKPTSSSLSIDDSNDKSKIDDLFKEPKPSISFEVANVASEGVANNRTSFAKAIFENEDNSPLDDESYDSDTLNKDQDNTDNNAFLDAQDFNKRVDNKIKTDCKNDDLNDALSNIPMFGDLDLNAIDDEDFIVKNEKGTFIYNIKTKDIDNIDISAKGDINYTQDLKELDNYTLKTDNTYVLENTKTNAKSLINNPLNSFKADNANTIDLKDFHMSNDSQSTKEMDFPKDSKTQDNLYINASDKTSDININTIDTKDFTKRFDENNQSEKPLNENNLYKKTDNSLFNTPQKSDFNNTKDGYDETYLKSIKAINIAKSKNLEAFNYQNKLTENLELIDKNTGNKDLSFNDEKSDIIREISLVLEDDIDNIDKANTSNANSFYKEHDTNIVSATFKIKDDSLDTSLESKAFNDGDNLLNNTKTSDNLLAKGHYDKALASSQSHDIKLAQHNDNTSLPFILRVKLFIRQFIAAFFTHTLLRIILPKIACKLGTPNPASMPFAFIAISILSLCGAIGMLLFTKSLSFSASVLFVLTLCISATNPFHGIHKIVCILSRKRGDSITAATVVVVCSILFICAFKTLFYVASAFEVFVLFIVAMLQASAFASSIAYTLEQGPVDSIGKMTKKGLIICLLLIIVPPFALLNPIVATSLIGSALFVRTLIELIYHKMSFTASRSCAYATTFLILIFAICDFVVLGINNEYLNIYVLDFINEHNLLTKYPEIFGFLDVRA